MFNASVAWRASQAIAGGWFRHRNFQPDFPHEHKPPPKLRAVRTEPSTTSEEPAEEPTTQTRPVLRKDDVRDQEEQLREQQARFWESLEQPQPRPIPKKTRKAAEEPRKGTLEELEQAVERKAIHVSNKILGLYVRIVLGWEGSLRDYLDMRVSHLLRRDDRRTNGSSLKRKLELGLLTERDIRERERRGLMLQINVHLAAPSAEWLAEPTVHGLFVRRIEVKHVSFFITLDAKRLRVVALYTRRKFRRAKSHRTARRQQFLRLCAVRRNGRRHFV